MLEETSKTSLNIEENAHVHIPRIDARVGLELTPYYRAGVSKLSKGSGSQDIFWAL